MTDRKRFDVRDHLPLIARTVSLLFLVGTIGLIVTTFIRRSRQVQTPAPVHAAPVLSGKIVSITEGYHYTTTEKGVRKFQLIAARDTSYDDGRHELEQLDLTAYSADAKEYLRILADHGVYRPDDGIVNLTGHVKVTRPEGLEVTTEALAYNQHDDVATTNVLVNFVRGAVSGSSMGGVLYAKTHVLVLNKDVHLINAAPEKAKDGLPVEVRGVRAEYAENDGIIRFIGEVLVTHGKQSARGESITGFFEPQSRRFLRIELRGQSSLRSEEPGKLSMIESRDMDFFFDEAQRLKLAVATGAARARSLEKDAPREMTAERLEAAFAPKDKGSELQTLTSQGRTTLKVGPEPAAAGSQKAVESVLEGDSLKASLRPDGKFLADAEAVGNAQFVMTPLVVTAAADRKRVRAAKFNADFYEKDNAIKSFLADGGTVVDFEPIAPESKRPRRTLSGRTMTGHVHEVTQEIADLTVEGDARFKEGERQATATRATYSSATQAIALRGKPVVWDAVARTNADEIDASLEDEQSFARGHVRTTYYSRDTTGGAAPFKKSKAPVFITSERAVVRHREGAARFTGDVRAWQDDNFISAETIELDRNERQMQAWNNVQSALYSIERELEDKRKEVVPTFVSADQMSYRDETRTVHYEGKVRIRQGTDRIDAAVADAIMDEENKLTQMTASREVVLTQPQRRGTGDRIEYAAVDETAVLTGNLAEVEDRERGVTTKGARLTLHLRDARIEANSESGAKRVRTTHRIQR